MLFFKEYICLYYRKYTIQIDNGLLDRSKQTPGFPNIVVIWEGFSWIHQICQASRRALGTGRHVDWVLLY